MTDAKWRLDCYVKSGENRYFFERYIEAPPISPFVGMVIYDLDGADEDLVVAGVTWEPRTKTVVIRLEDEDYTSHSIDVASDFSDWKPTGQFPPLEDESQ
ncbi:hypothetical protein UFOVP1229_156 [uncultured Caudovirales phage]|uniref:Uncharacterized protein n=1 Tax=uncultured Caudovirales phage TaxID=2100421 RepID=A0A6J5R3D8_9CAUD|nr:hypothetical protein UFOVP1229_156 [uncultured Caudovirales phage]